MDTRTKKRDVFKTAIADGLSVERAIQRAGCTRRYAQRLLDDPGLREQSATLAPSPEARLYRECEALLISNEIKPNEKPKLIATMSKLRDTMDRQGQHGTQPAELIAFLEASGL